MQTRPIRPEEKAELEASLPAGYTAVWLEAGTRMVVVLNPRRRAAQVHRPGAVVRILNADDVLDGEDVVPGWRVALTDLFPDDIAD